MNTAQTIKDLTVTELQELIRKTVKSAIEDEIEELKALSNPEFLKSIEEARRDYQEGRCKDFEEVF